jgi:hypothetical protein
MPTPAVNHCVHLRSAEASIMSARHRFVAFLLFAFIASLPVWADDAGIQVQTEKPGVKVTVDDVYRGETAKGVGGMIYILVPLTPGKHVLRCEYPGMKTLVDPGIMIIDGQYLPYQVKFEQPKVQVTSTSTETGKQQVETGTIIVNSKPSPAYVDLDGSRMGHTRAVLAQVAVGVHRVRVYFDSDTQLATDVELAADQTVTIMADFSATPARIWTDAKYAVSFVSDPPGTLTLDGKVVGDLPKTVTLQNGRHSFSVSRDGYRTVEQSIDVSGLKLYKLALEKIDWRILVTSDPAGSSVQVDGKEAGVTPASVPVSRGAHSVRVARDHYTAWTGTVTVSSREQESVSAALSRVEYQLRVEAAPSGARVAVDGAAAVSSPWAGWLKPGAHSVSVSAPNCSPVTQTVNLQADTVLPINLDRQNGQVSITTNPANAQILIDGTVVGTGTATATLPAGYHQVSFSLKNCYGRETQIEVRGGQTAVVAAELVKLKPGFSEGSSFPGRLPTVQPDGLVDEYDSRLSIEYPRSYLSDPLGGFLNGVFDLSMSAGVISCGVWGIYYLTTLAGAGRLDEFNYVAYVGLGLTGAGIIGNAAIGCISIETNKVQSDAKVKHNQELWAAVAMQNDQIARKNSQLLAEANAQVERDNDALRQNAKTTVTYR